MSDVTCYEDLPHRYASPRSQEALAALRDRGGEASRSYFDDLFAKGTAYAWGRMDSPGFSQPVHHGDAFDFAIAFTIHAGEDGATHAIREAYDAWHATGRIER